MHKLAITVIMTLLSIQIQSQTNNEYDFIVTNQNDTVIGVVNMVDNLAKETVCIFTPADDSIQVYLSPYEISSYQLYDGSKFVSISSGKT